jgi:subtilisin family serine protease
VLICALFLFGGVSSGAAGSLTQASWEAKQAVYGQLNSKALQDGSVRVIVTLNIPFQPEGQLTALGRNVQRTAIRRVQNALSARLSASNAQVLKEFSRVPFMVVRVDASDLATLANDASVSLFQEDVAVPPVLVETIPLIGADLTWSMGYTGLGGTVAVLDTGVDSDHEFLVGKVVAEACFSTNDPIGGATSLCPGGQEQVIGPGAGENCPTSTFSCDHGTHVAGIAVGNGSSMNGVAPDASLISVQVFSQFQDPTCSNIGIPSSPCALTFTSDQISALDWVYSQRDTFDIAAVNMSFGGGQFTATCDTDARKVSIDQLRSADIASAVASGNNGYIDALTAPACISSAISTGSINKSDQISAFSNIAPFLDLLAPGESVYSSLPGDSYSYFSGTSMAAPHVAGAWALLQSVDPNASVDEILSALQTTGTLLDDNRSGGIETNLPRIQVDAAAAALEAALPTSTPTQTATPTPTATATPTFTPTPTLSVQFAVIGDYGFAGQAEADVAGLVGGWNPDLIITTGDNNYPNGEASTIDANIGQYFHSFIYPYSGSYGSGAAVNRFFPSLGNHDWYTPNAQPYLDYFALPGNERYYDFVWGPVHFFALNSDLNEPDGRTSSSAQGQWLQGALAASTSPWKIVYMHHAPYSSAMHGPTTIMQWPFASWGASAVLAGHDHTYERLQVDGIPYFVNGLGGRSIYNFGTPLAESLVRFNSDYGAMKVNADESQVTFQFVDTSGSVVDTHLLVASTPTPTPVPTATPGPLTTWYLAEGYTGAGFGTYILVQNPNGTDANLDVSYLLQGGSPIQRQHLVPASSRYTIIAADPGEVGADQAFSTTLTSDNPVIVERAMYFSNGGHNTIGLTAPSAIWYLAEGFTGADFSTFILVQNPGALDATVDLTYLLQEGSPIQRQHIVPANSRYTIVAGDPSQVGADQAFSTIVNSDQPVIVERAMYFGSGGHNTVGVTAPSTTWYLAEGYTGGGFGTYILIQNPNSTEAQLDITYLLQGGSPIQTLHVAPGDSRYTIVAADINEVGPDQAFSTTVSSDVPVIVERAMYFTNGGHNTIGITSPSTMWNLAEGFTGAGFSTFILIQNPNGSVATVDVTYQLQIGAPIQRQHLVPANSRYTIVAADAAEVGLDQAFSTTLVSDQPIIVERAMYFGSGGHNTVGVKDVPKII